MLLSLTFFIFLLPFFTFSSLSSTFSIFLPFFLTLFFPVSHQNPPGGKSLGGHCAPLPACYTTGSYPHWRYNSSGLLVWQITSKKGNFCGPNSKEFVVVVVANLQTHVNMWPRKDFKKEVTKSEKKSPGYSGQVNIHLYILVPINWLLFAATQCSSPLSKLKYWNTAMQWRHNNCVACAVQQCKAMLFKWTLRVTKYNWCIRVN